MISSAGGREGGATSARGRAKGAGTPREQERSRRPRSGIGLRWGRNDERDYGNSAGIAGRALRSGAKAAWRAGDIAGGRITVDKGVLASSAKRADGANLRD